jgi:hypothetical protein
MSEIKNRLWYPVARELKGEDPYRFLRAYTAGTILGGFLSS